MTAQRPKNSRELYGSNTCFLGFRRLVRLPTRFPKVGRAFYQAGPAYSIARISEYLRTKVDDGTLRPVDVECAAMQFLELIQCGQVKPRLFASIDLVTTRSVEEVVEAGVQLFLRGLQP